MHLNLKKKKPKREKKKMIKSAMMKVFGLSFFFFCSGLVWTKSTLFFCSNIGYIHMLRPPPGMLCISTCIHLRKSVCAFEIIGLNKTKQGTEVSGGPTSGTAPTSVDSHLTTNIGQLLTPLSSYLWLS